MENYSTNADVRQNIKFVQTSKAVSAYLRGLQQKHPNLYIAKQIYNIDIKENINDVEIASYAN